MTVTRLFCPPAGGPAERAANAPAAEPVLVAFAAWVLRGLAREAEGASLSPSFAGGAAAADAPLVLLAAGLHRVARRRRLSPVQLERLAAWLERADTAASEYLAIVRLDLVEHDQRRVFDELDLHLGSDGCAIDLGEPPRRRSWAATCEALDRLDWSLGRRHRLRRCEPDLGGAANVRRLDSMLKEPDP